MPARAPVCQRGGGLPLRRRFASAAAGLPARGRFASTGAVCLCGAPSASAEAVCLYGARLPVGRPLATARGVCRRESMCRLPAPYGNQISLKVIRHEYKSGRKVFSVRTDEVLAAFCPTEPSKKVKKQLVKFAMEDGCVLLL